MNGTQTPKEVLSGNMAVFMEQGPGLSTRYNVCVLARDRARKRVLLGGLGCMGCGEMWAEEAGNKRYPGFIDAREEPEFPQCSDVEVMRAAAGLLKPHLAARLREMADELRDTGRIIATTSAPTERTNGE